MTIKYIKKADKTASSDEAETRQRVQDVLKEIESKRDEVSQKFLVNLINMKVKLLFQKKKLKKLLSLLIKM